MVQPTDAYWPAHLSQRLGAATPAALYALGPVTLLKAKKTCPVLFGPNSR